MAGERSSMDPSSSPSLIYLLYLNLLIRGSQADRDGIKMASAVRTSSAEFELLQMMSYSLIGPDNWPSLQLTISIKTLHPWLFPSYKDDKPIFKIEEA